MAINIDFDDNKSHVLAKQRFMNYAFIIRKWFYEIEVFWTKMKVFDNLWYCFKILDLDLFENI